MRASMTYAMSTAAGAIGTVAGTIDHPKPRSTSTSATPAWTLHASRPLKRMLASPLLDHQPCHKHGQPDVRRDHDERRSMTPPRYGSRGQEQQHGYGRRQPLEAWCQEQVEEKRAGHYRSCQYHLRARRSYATEREQDTHDHGRPPKDHGDKWHSVLTTPLISRPLNSSVAHGYRPGLVSVFLSAGGRLPSLHVSPGAAPGKPCRSIHPQQ